MKKGRRFGDIVSNVYLILLSIVAVFPLLWLLVSAFKSSSEMLNNPTKIWPIQWTLANFKTVLFTLKFTVNIRNSLSFRDTKTTTGTTTKLFIRPDNLRVLVLGFIDLLPFQPVQQFIPPHQQSVSNVERRKSRILRKRQNSDDANDAESGIWYRDILKTASLASSASLSSRKNSAGVWGTPQKCACG